MDIALAKSGPEAIVESFYYCMCCQKCPDEKSNWILTTWAKVAWCLSSVDRCDKIIRDAASVYMSSDDKIKGHQQNVFFTTNRHKNYNVSNVINRVNADRGRCPFLAWDYWSFTFDIVIRLSSFVYEGSMFSGLVLSSFLHLFTFFCIFFY